MSWQLWRQDDNGNRFLVGEWEQRDDAERRMEELCRFPHKQIYWVERCCGRSNCPDSAIHIHGGG